MFGVQVSLYSSLHSLGSLVSSAKNIACRIFLRLDLFNIKILVFVSWKVLLSSSVMVYILLTISSYGSHYNLLVLGMHALNSSGFHPFHL